MKNSLRNSGGVLREIFDWNHPKKNLNWSFKGHRVSKYLRGTTGNSELMYEKYFGRITGKIHQDSAKKKNNKQSYLGNPKLVSGVIRKEIIRYVYIWILLKVLNENLSGTHRKIYARITG